MGKVQVAARKRAAHWAERLSIWCLAALVVTLPLWRYRVLRSRFPKPVFFEFRDFILYANDIVWGGTLGAWLLSRRLSHTRSRWQLGPRCLFGLLAGLVLLSFIGVPWAAGSTYAAYQSLRLLLLLVLYLMVLKAPVTSALIAWSLVASTVLQAAVALPQFVLGHSLGLQRLGEVFIYADWPGASVVMVGNERWLRAYGLTQHPNLLGGCLMAFLLLIAGYYFSQSGGRCVPFLTALGVGLAALLVTFSRSAWLGTAVGGLAMLVLLTLPSLQREQSLDWKTMSLLVAVGLAVVTLFATTNWPLLVSRSGLTSQGVEIRSVQERHSLSTAAWALIQQRPLLGVGLGNFSTALYWYVPEVIDVYPYQPVHNVALLATAELGFLGGVLWLGLMVVPWITLWLERHQVRMTPWLAGLSGALAALAVVSWLDAYIWSSQQGRLLQWLIWGLWAKEWERATIRRET